MTYDLGLGAVVWLTQQEYATAGGEHVGQREELHRASGIHAVLKQTSEDDSDRDAR